MIPQALNSIEGPPGGEPRPLKTWERWLVPGILAGIALAQIAGTRLTPLSPWKGGGFGMFSTVDGPGMRVLQAEGIDEEGRILRLDVLGSLGGDLPEKLQALPNLDDLGPMAAGLVEQEWVAMDAEEQYFSQLAREKNAEAERQGKPAPEAAAPPGGTAPGERPAAIPPPAGTDLPPLFRVRSPNDLPGVPGRHLRSVRLQWWRIRWDDRAAKLHTEPLGREVRFGERLWPDEQGAGE